MNADQNDLDLEHSRARLRAEYGDLTLQLERLQTASAAVQQKRIAVRTQLEALEARMVDAKRDVLREGEVLRKAARDADDERLELRRQALFSQPQAPADEKPKAPQWECET